MGCESYETIAYDRITELIIKTYYKVCEMDIDEQVNSDERTLVRLVCNIIIQYRVSFHSMYHKILESRSVESGIEMVAERTPINENYGRLLSFLSFYAFVARKRYEEGASKGEVRLLAIKVADSVLKRCKDEDLREWLSIIVSFYLAIGQFHFIVCLSLDYNFYIKYLVYKLKLVDVVEHISYVYKHIYIYIYDHITSTNSKLMCNISLIF